VKSLVSDMRQLRCLEMLLAAGNELQTLPKNLDYLYTLRVLNVGANDLAAFVVPKSVIELDLSSNPLILPSSDARHSMFSRMAADSSIHSRTVTTLNASHLHLTDLPSVVAKLKCLAILDVSHNKLKVVSVTHRQRSANVSKPGSSESHTRTSSSNPAVTD